MPSQSYTILLPPSETKASGGDQGQTWAMIADDGQSNAFRVLNDARATVIETLQKTMGEQPRTEMEKLFRVKDERLAEAISTNWNILSGPLLTAIHRYTGVMFDFLDFDGMASDTQDAFNRNTIFFSGVWGLLRPSDLIPDYKLRIDASLPGLGRLSNFWKPHISAILNPMLAGQVVWDFLPNAHARAWDGDASLAARWQIKFVQQAEKDGEIQYRTVSHWSKALKGALVRFICANEITDPAAFIDFEHPQGYVYTPERSDLGDKGGELVFVKR